ncbi:TetR/AcrR family transcriptional regulator [Massilia sp. TSP1-1-2]|uniref:TetR/AcrR family transcriptional regulator n=1 Tax=unclassified Massilia TaxID=2609279 RepID=UPI003CF4B9C5
MGRHKTVQDEQIRDLARAVFLEHGAVGSTKEIARRAGISEATLFQRYPTKAALFMAAMVPPVVDIDAIMGTGLAPQDVRSALVAIGHRMLAYFRQLIPVLLQLLTHPSINIADISSHFERSPPVALTEALADFLDQAGARGVIAKHDHLPAAGLFIAAIHSLPLFELMGVHGGNTEQLIDGFVEALWRGMQPPVTSTPLR